MTRFTIEPISATDNSFTECQCGIECHAHCTVEHGNNCLILPAANVVIDNTNSAEDNEFGVEAGSLMKLALCEFCVANYVSRLIT